MIAQMLSVAKRLFGTIILGGPPAVTGSQVAVPIAPQRREHPRSGAMVRLVEVLVSRPDVTAAEVAPELGISVSYARTLLRRARGSSPSPATEVRNTGLFQARTPDTSVAEIMSRLTSAERELLEIRSRRIGPKGRWDISCRAEVIRRSLAGETSGQIASALGVPEGEVRFILKIQRLLMKAS
ncbi:MAG: hypothetical protein SGI92_01645 [Bryobacteraceae bacterium]|nr:hypothetical protein [Bryobacteraceae bacterium]